MSRNQILSVINEDHPAGARMIEVSESELTRVYGGGDVQPETSPGCYVGGVVIGVTLSLWKCK